MPVGASRSALLSLPSAIPDSGVTRLTFNDADTDATTATDVWGDNDGTINGATTGVTGANQTYTTNEAYSFDGVDDYVNLGQDAFESLYSGGEISIALWFKDDGATSIKYPLSIEGYVAFQFGSGVIDGYVTGASSDSVSTSTPASGTWSHLVLAYDGSTQALYLDGVEKDSAAASLGDYTSVNRDVVIGAQYDKTDHFDGDIDDIRLYNKGLSSTQVSDLYNTGSI